VIENLNLNQGNDSSTKYCSLIGYGTFITRGFWKDKSRVQVCKVKNYRRIYPEGYWFPFVLPADDSFWALKFDVNQNQLDKFDRYEGVPSGLFQREVTQIELKDSSLIQAYIYVPTLDLIKSENLSLELDTCDRWKEEIKKIPEIIDKFPELVY